MYDTASGTPAIARTSNLNEDLGQVNTWHTFSGAVLMLLKIGRTFIRLRVIGVTH